MSDNIHTRIKFDGPALEGKSMDVAHLAPALLALSDLVKTANAYANDERAGIKVFVNADLEQKCFELNIELVLTIWEQAKLLIADERVIAAKEIAEWIGLIAGSAGGGTFGLYKLIKNIRGRKITSVTVLKAQDGKSSVEIQVEGDHDPIKVSKAVYELYANHQIRKKAIDVLAPLREEGYESLEFYEGDDIYVAFETDDVPAADGADMPEVIPQNLHTSKIRTGVRIRKAAYEGTSKWTLVYKRAIDASIDDVEWLTKFQNSLEPAPPGSSLDVDLEESYVTNDHGEIIGDPSYRVIKVHGVSKPLEQQTLEFKIDGE